MTFICETESVWTVKISGSDQETAHKVHIQSLLIHIHSAQGNQDMNHLETQTPNEKETGACWK